MNIQVGDLITSYHKGYHVVTDIDGDIIHYRKVANENGAYMTRSGLCCHVQYCEKVDEAFITNQNFIECHNAAVKMDNLLSLLEDIEHAKSKADKTI